MHIMRVPLRPLAPAGIPLEQLMADNTAIVEDLDAPITGLKCSSDVKAAVRQSAPAFTAPRGYIESFEDTRPPARHWSDSSDSSSSGDDEQDPHSWMLDDHQDAAESEENEHTEATKDSKRVEGGNTEPETVPPDEEIRKALRSLTAKGSFAAGGLISHDGVTSPDIEVAGFGPLQLPLCPADVATLKQQHFSQAPFGLGERTLVDTAVRNTLQLSPSQFTVAPTSSWLSLLASVIDDTTAGLGLAGVKVAAHLHKLLMYEPGGFFARHRDSEKEDGMIGTLVVQLPSCYSGGELVVRHQGQQLVFGPQQPGGSNSSCGLSWAAFYADCEHEVKEVTRGHRLCLVYNLVVARDSSSTSRSSSSLATPTLPQDFYALMSAAKKYTTAGRSGVDCLKGRDRQRAALLQHVAAQEGLGVALAKASLTQHGDDEEGIDEMNDRYELEQVEVLFSGTAGAAGLQLGSMSLSKEDLEADGFCFEDLSPDGEEHEGPTGNEGAPMSQWYHHAAFVLWPKSALHELVRSLDCWLQLLDASSQQAVAELQGQQQEQQGQQQVASAVETSAGQWQPSDELQEQAAAVTKLLQQAGARPAGKREFGMLLQVLQRLLQLPGQAATALCMLRAAAASLIKVYFVSRADLSQQLQQLQQLMALTLESFVPVVGWPTAGRVLQLVAPKLASQVLEYNDKLPLDAFAGDMGSAAFYTPLRLQRLEPAAAPTAGGSSGGGTTAQEQREQLRQQAGAVAAVKEARQMVEAAVKLTSRAKAITAAEVTAGFQVLVLLEWSELLCQFVEGVASNLAGLTTPDLVAAVLSIGGWLGPSLCSSCGPFKALADSALTSLQSALTRHAPLSNLELQRRLTLKLPCGVDCDCDVCVRLEQFLTDGTAMTCRLDFVEDDARHLEEQLYWLCAEAHGVTLHVTKPAAASQPLRPAVGYGNARAGGYGGSSRAPAGSGRAAGQPKAPVRVVGELRKRDPAKQRKATKYQQAQQLLAELQQLLEAAGVSAVELRAAAEGSGGADVHERPAKQQRLAPL